MKQDVFLADRITWKTNCKNLRDYWADEEVTDTPPYYNIYTFLKFLNKNLPTRCNVVSDAGSAFYSTGQVMKLSAEQRLIISASQADMGCAVPASIGVSLADPLAKTIVVTGDGSFASNVQELATIKKHSLPITIFVLNNDGYLSIRNTQNKFYDGRVYGVNSKTGLWFPDLEDIAKTFHFDYRTIVNDGEDLNTKVKDCIETSYPTICNICCDPEQEIIPTQALKNVNGVKVQPSLADMYPFKDDAELFSQQVELLKGAEWVHW